MRHKIIKVETISESAVVEIGVSSVGGVERTKVLASLENSVHAEVSQALETMRLKRKELRIRSNLERLAAKNLAENIGRIEAKVVGSRAKTIAAKVDGSHGKMTAAKVVETIEITIAAAVTKFASISAKGDLKE